MDRRVIQEEARAFIKSLAARARSRFEMLPRREQKSVWVLPTSDTSYQSQNFSREIVDKEALSMFAQMSPEAGWTEMTQLRDALVSAGVGPEFTRFGYIVPLMNRWVDFVNPFEPTSEEIGGIVDELWKVIHTSEVVVTSATLTDIDFGRREQVRLDDSLLLRPISTEELWSLGEYPKMFSTYRIEEILHMLRPGFLCVETFSTRPQSTSQLADTLQSAATAALRLISPGHFQCLPLGQFASYGMGAVGRSFYGGTHPVGHGLGSGSYSLGDEQLRRFASVWPRLRGIFGGKRHFLRLPAQRLVDGGIRKRDDDAIVDYSIGLEALLISGAGNELAYRFALRGAAVVGWTDTKQMKEHFGALKSLYRTRSKIVHGDSLDTDQLNQARAIGEVALRETWWWFYENAEESVDQGISRIDDRILQ